MSDKAQDVSRRAFIGTSAAAAAAFAFPSGLFARGSDVIRVGLVGCGGRGSGAARDCLTASPGVELVALGDLVPDRLSQCREELDKVASENADFASKYKVTADRTFTGFDAYKKVLAADIDLVILATPPGFRPLHLTAAVEAGKHIFAEKPVAVDPAGVRQVLAAYEAAMAKRLAIGVGTQRRHQAEYVETIKRIQGGAIGDILSGQVFWNQGGLWSRTKEAAWSDGEWQIRNWLYFAWLSGDHIVEQHVHNIDVANWVMGAHPVKATGVGGRQFRTDARFGHIYDHFAIDFEYANGARVVSMCRQIPGTANRIGEHFIGTKGRSNAAGEITGNASWKFASPSKPVPMRRCAISPSRARRARSSRRSTGPRGARASTAPMARARPMTDPSCPARPWDPTGPAARTAPMRALRPTMRAAGRWPSAASSIAAR